MRSRSTVHIAITLTLMVCLLTAVMGPATAAENCPDETATDCGLDEDPDHPGLYEGPNYNASNETDVNAFTDWVVSRPGALLSL